MKNARRQSGFTLIEMLVVIVILGLLAGLTVPALKNISKANVTVSSARQLLDDVGRARQLAMSQRTTVFMVFVPTNYWLSLPVTTELTNLADKQLTGYTYISYGTVGDQPGQHTWNYLAPWQNLPDGTFIAQQKFMPPNLPPFYISAYNSSVPIYGFDTNALPFPTEDSPKDNSGLPCIAFNYLGQLTSAQMSPLPLGQDEYIPLAQGSVFPAMDAQKNYSFNPPSVSEIPPGNSTNSSFNLVHIDWLTGRATLEYQKVQ